MEGKGCATLGRGSAGSAGGGSNGSWGLEGNGAENGAVYGEIGGTGAVMGGKE